jgi:ribose 1,5-bisphosphokinase
MTGRFIAVVGPSGVGKDSVMQAMAAHDPRLVLARRIITRPSDAGGEVFQGVTEDAFETQKNKGCFKLHWAAHGLQYAIPISVEDTLRQGQDVLANLSRAVLGHVKNSFERFEVIHLTADHDILAARLAARDRETAEQISHRLNRASHQLPAGLTTYEIDNSGLLDQTVQSALAHLYPVRA